MGNRASLLLYTAPVLTFSRVFKKKSTEEFSCLPYVMTLFNCLIYTWYGLPIVSHCWENFSLVSINGVGIVLESIFSFVYFCYASPKEKIKVGVIFVRVIVVFGLTTAISAVVFEDHRHRKSFVGSVGLVASISMYGSPLIVMKKVIETKSAEYMPFHLSFFSFLASSIWLAYGLLSHDLFLALPNMVGTPLGILQLIIYFKYKNKKEAPITTTVVGKSNGTMRRTRSLCHRCLLRNLPWECTEDELIELGKPFANTKCNRDIAAAEQRRFKASYTNDLGLRFFSSSDPAQVRGKTVYLQYSNRQEIVNNKTAADVVGNVLLVTVEGDDARMVSIDVFNLVFSAFGFVHKITTFEKTAGYQALVQFSDADTATTAKTALDGRNIPSYLLPEEVGQCSLKITYSAHTDLTVKFQSHRSRDYTNPYLPVAPSAIDSTGQVIVGVDGKKMEPESNVLLASIENMQYAVTLDVLHTVFATFGAVQKIAMFDKNGGMQALIQFPGQIIKLSSEGSVGRTFCTSLYSRHTDLSIKVNNDRSRDHTLPNPPDVVMSRPSGLNPYPEQYHETQGQSPYMAAPSPGSMHQGSGGQMRPPHHVQCIRKKKKKFRSIPCSLSHDNVASDSDGNITDSAETRLVSDGDRLVSEQGTSEDILVNSGGEGAEVKGAEEDTKKSKFPVVVLLMGVWAYLKRAMEKVIMQREWWPFSRPEKRLQKLIAQADANPLDAALQGALFAELNKHIPEAVVQRFEQREHAVDSRGVAEYIRALVITNAISDFLPDEQSGKPSTLPTLLQELKHRASGNMDDSFANPGISERQPLHVTMVNPKVSNKSRFAQELVSTILFTVAVGLVWLMGAAALQKYIGSLGGVGTSGVGSTSSFSTKEVNKEITPEKNLKTFKDVKGCDDAKQELEEVVEYLKNPSKFTRLGGKLPKGILLTGSPGTGKTLLAKAIAGEAGVPFFYRAGSEFEEMFVGVGAKRVRSLFQAAKKKAPCIIFIDEIDAVGSTRKQWEGHTKKTLHQLLVEMDGFEQNEGIIVMAATNLADILDPALTRPGRFDRHIVVPSPDVRGRQEILELYLQGKPMSDDVDVKAIARGTPGFNGADLANLVNIAAIKAAVEGAEKLSAEQLEFAKDRIVMGTERKTMFVSEDSKKLTAYHESGHAIVALNTGGAHPIHKATIMPRGSALGMVTQLPSNDETSVSKKQLLARLDVCMGGRVAEELIFGQDHITTGASSDLSQATELAQYMVSSCGMCEAIGPVHIKERPSSEMQSRIDAEVVKLLREAYERVKSLLKRHEKQLHTLANALLEYETLNAEDIKRILLPNQEGEKLQEQQEEGHLVLA
ncbi:hypothetical protein HID58_038168 [Brassica napus]|uniref:AAA+ ATPase domain-containing protein n=2 Tax=Brassica TaxID=3705 RepID=A0ABQ8BND0_BRANA|nr:hypothetical protein HID58_038168 [Brassica napus]